MADIRAKRLADMPEGRTFAVVMAAVMAKFDQTTMHITEEEFEEAAANKVLVQDAHDLQGGLIFTLLDQTEKEL